MEGRDKPLKLRSNRPSFGLKNGTIVLINLRQEPPAWSAICDVVARWTAFVVARVELADDVRFAVPHMPDEGFRISFEDFDGLVSRIVDGELPGHGASCVESERFQAGVATNGEAGDVPILADQKASLALNVKLCRTARSSFEAQPKSSAFPLILERGRSRIEHL